MKEKLQWTSQKYKGFYKKTVKGYMPPAVITYKKWTNS